MYKLFLTLRYLRKRRIAYFAIAAVMLCSAMVLVVMSVMGGWLDLVRQHARGLLGDIVIDNRTYQGFPLYDVFLDEIRDWPEIAAATPVLYTAGLMRFPETSQLNKVNIVGIRLHEVYQVNAFREGLFYERWFPGTTTLAEQRQPRLGRDYTATPRPTADGAGRFLPFVLPEPYASAWAKARSAYEKTHGKPPTDFGTVPTVLHEFLVSNGEPPIPGVWEFDPDNPLPGYLGDPLPGIIIGRDILAQRQSDGRYLYPEIYPKGCKVTLTVWATSTEGSVDPIPIKRAFRYADDSRTGIYEIDSQSVYVDFDLLQKLLSMDAAERVDPQTGEVVGRIPARCHQIQIKLRPGYDVLAVCRKLEDAFHRLADDPKYALDARERELVLATEALTWEQSQAHIIVPIEKEKVLVTILFGIISLVAVALVLCILYMIVLGKTRDIGIVKAIGGSSGGLALVFIYYGAAVGIVGSLLGTSLGALFVHYINEIQDLLIRINPAWRVWDMKVYSFDRIPNQVDPADALTVIVVGILAATFGSLAAAWRAGRMQPVEAIRYE